MVLLCWPNGTDGSGDNLDPGCSLNTHALAHTPHCQLMGTQVLRLECTQPPGSEEGKQESRLRTLRAAVRPREVVVLKPQVPEGKPSLLALKLL